MLLFDISKLFSSIKRKSPTGIDRVEMHYFNYLIQSELDVKFVFKFRHHFFIGKHDEVVKLFQRLNFYWTHRHSPNVIDESDTIISIKKKLIDSSWIHKTKLHTKMRTTLGYTPLDAKLRDVIKQSNHQVMYLNVSHANVENTSFLANLKELDVKIVCMLHDLIPVTHPMFCTSESTHKHQIRLKNLVNYADVILSNSAYTKQEFERYLSQYKLSYTKEIFVTPLGTEILKPQLNAPMVNDTNYFIVVGTIEARKNHQLLLDIWISLTHQYGEEKCPKLYIVGKRGWRNEEFFKKLDEFKIKHQSIYELNNIEDDLLYQLVKNAKAMLMPTYIEGWCMPVTEALLMGVPVICSDIPVLRESGQNIPTYVEVNNQKAWELAIQTCLASEQHGHKNEFQPYLWQNHLEQVFAKI